ncbi:MAG: hypothetical protein R2939_18650 [Kofleriaceae bacterium]
MLVRGLGHDLVVANALKTVATLALATVVVPIFVVADLARWGPAAAAGGSAASARCSACFAVRRDQAQPVIVVIALVGAVVVGVRGLTQG